MAMRPIVLRGLLGAASAATFASSALPQENVSEISDIVLQEVVVTAQKRSENVQKVPVSITALTADQLAAQQIETPADLVRSVTSLQVNTAAGQAIPIFSLRGISMMDFSLAQNGPIAVYYDEVYKGNFAILGLGMFDLERVEVLKGPQGTLYGKNTTGGAINFVSRKPQFESGVDLTAGFANYNRYTIDAAAETALGETLGARLAFTLDRGDGWVDNKFPGGEDANSTRQFGIRGSLRFRPSDILDVTVRASTSFQNPWNFGVVAIPGPEGIGGPVYDLFGLSGDFRNGLGRREINTPDIEKRHIRTHAAAVNADIELSDALTLTSVSSWDRGEISWYEDGEGSFLPVTDGTFYGKTKQIAQDLRLTSHSTGPFNFIVGAYFNKEDIENSTTYQYVRDLDLNGDGSIDAQDCIDGGFFLPCAATNQFDQIKTSYAAYTDAIYALTDQLTLRGGLRYTHDRGKLRNFYSQIRGLDGMPLLNLIPGSEIDLFATDARDFKDDDVSGKVGLDYQLTDTVLLYASYSRGYRGSAFNAQAIYTTNELTTAKPEKIQAAEVGLKSELFNRRVRLNGAAFWYGYKDQQFLNFDPDTQELLLINLPKSRIYGGELDLHIRATDSLTLSLGMGAIDTEVKRGSALGIDVSGNRLVSAPSFTLTSAVDWSIPLFGWGAADARIDVAHASGQYYDIINRPTVYEDGYTLLNSLVRFHPMSNQYGVTLWVRNLTDEQYYTNLLDASGFGYTYAHTNEPRTYGLSFDVKFGYNNR